MKYTDAKSRIVLAGGRNKFPSRLVASAISNGLIQVVKGNLSITSAGKSKLKRNLCDHDPFASQHRLLQPVQIKLDGTPSKAIENCAESPLARLYARKLKDGTRFLSQAEYEAGERLRRDFEKSQLQPSLSAGWQQGVSTGNKSSRHAGGENISDFAIDARARIENALTAIGPELTGITLDICCFLKGLVQVESERSWPVRSAKLMLKTALSMLARHYGFDNGAEHRARATSSSIGHWGAGNYRPSMTGQNPGQPG